MNEMQTYDAPTPPAAQQDGWMNQEQKEIIRKQFFPPQATAIDMKYCMQVAESFNLNPILKQIYFVPRKAKINGQWCEKIEPMAGHASFLTLAHRSGGFAGMSTIVEVRRTPKLINGSWTEDTDLVAICHVWRTDTNQPFIVEVAYEEYVAKTNAGDITKFWKEKPKTMLKKVAESQALRKAFDITGLYSKEEMGNDYEYSQQQYQETRVEDAFLVTN